MKKAYLLGILLVAITAYAGSYKDLFPLMKDIKGWKAESPNGSSMQGMMTTATKTYTKGNSTFTVAIVKSKMGGAFGAGLTNVNMENNEAKAKIETIRGFKVTSSFSKNEKEGGFVVVLDSKGAMLSLNFQKMSLESAKEILLKFDWKKINTTLKKL